MVSNHSKDKEDRLLDLNRDLAHPIEALHQADQRLHHMMSIEFSSLASTMDELDPGFWSKYMQNRQQIFQQYMKEREQHQKEETPATDTLRGSSRRESPFEGPKDAATTTPEETPERISLFSEALDQELPPLKRYDRL